MRNIFDQYDQPENRLSHALAVCLHEDRELLRDFLAWVGTPTKAAQQIHVTEQSLPGEPPAAEAEAERRGLPDLIVHDGAEWCVLVESKIQAALTQDQLRRHERTLRRRGFERITCVALTKAGVRTPPDIVGRTWSGLYERLGKVGRGREWPERLRSYLRIAEVRLAREGYLTEGTLTMFDGFPFSADNPYTYGEAKRLLRLAVGELRADPKLRAIGVDPDRAGRTRIIDNEGLYVWDRLTLADHPTGRAYSEHPHLTLAIHRDLLEIALSLPKGMDTVPLRRLGALDGGLHDLHREVLRSARPILGTKGWVEVFALQRHYHTRSSPPTDDARMYCKLDTDVPTSGTRVRHLPDWTRFFAALLRDRPADLHFAYSVRLPWGTPGLDTRDALRVMADGWLALAPVLDVVRGGSDAP